MSDPRLESMRDLIQEDVGKRGLRTDTVSNLITACPWDFAAACRSIAEHPAPAVCVVTGFFIPHGQPPACETDGPLGAVFLARAFAPLKIPVLLVGDRSLEGPLEVGLDAAGLRDGSSNIATTYIDHPPHGIEWMKSAVFPDGAARTHLIALERVGPSHTLASIRAQPGATPEAVAAFEQSVPAAEHDRCHSMRGRDITEFTGPAHLLFEHAAAQSPRVTTIGIGDGGNEIGMGKVPWDVIRRNIPRGDVVACRVPTDHLIVCGVSNWGAYGLAAGVRLLRGAGPDRDLFDVARERELLRVMVERGPLVDGVTGRPTVSVDGLAFERYADPLRELGKMGP
jgi:D-glutamate cyclase